MIPIIWMMVIIMSIESAVSGNMAALGMGMLLAMIGIFLEARRSDEI